VTDLFEALADGTKDLIIVIFPRVLMRLVILRLVSTDDVKNICRRVWENDLLSTSK
jgi:hypothetical protein